MIEVMPDDREDATQAPNSPMTPASGWSDDPITSSDDDKYGRTSTAEWIAELINRNPSEDASIVYGIEGPWGSGKTSVINMIRDRLTEMDNKWKIAPFTPWATEGTDALLSEFYSLLAEHIDGLGNDSRFRKLALKVGRYGSPFLRYAPVVGPALQDTADRLVSDLEGKKSWDTLFNEVAEVIRNRKIKLLIVVDDIDRLQIDELLPLLKIVRLLGRFPGIDFLLAYDRASITSIFQQNGGSFDSAYADRFIEKIVQHPLTLPPVLPSKAAKIIQSELNTVLAKPIQITWNSPIPGASFSLTKSPLWQIIPSIFSTPRSIHRFLTHFKEEHAKHKRGEINEQDLILTTILRMNFPDTFSLVLRSKDLLCSPKPKKTKEDRTRENSERGSNKPEQNSEWQQRIDTIRSRPNNEAGTIILEHLFPILRESHLREPEPGRISHPDYFFRYFAQTIPEDDISDIELGNILENASSGKDSFAISTLFSREEIDPDLLMRKLIRLYPRPDSITSPSSAIGPVSTNLLAQSLQYLSKQSDISRKDTRLEIQMTFAARILYHLAYSGESVESIEGTLKSAGLPSKIEAKLLVCANQESPEGNSPRQSTLSTIETRLVSRNLDSIAQRFLRRDDFFGETIPLLL